MTRIVSVWLPSFATDRRHRAAAARPAPSAAPAKPLAAKPLVVVTADHGGLRIAAVDAAGEAAGIVPGMALADARALCPGLAVAPEDVAGDRAALVKLAAWCGRYTPWVGLDRFGDYASGLFLDVTGCAHLLGGEAALIADLTRRLAGLGIAARAAVADTPGAAWAVARFVPPAANVHHLIVPPGATAAALASLPVMGLRIAPETAAALDRLGLKTIGTLARLPRTALAARFGAGLVGRLDAALGYAREPIAALEPAPALRASLVFAEPIAHQDGVAHATARLLAALSADLARAALGARRLTLAFYRADGEVVSVVIGTSRPTRDARHLTRLFAERAPLLDLGFGADAAVLAATIAEPLPAEQMTLRVARGAAVMAATSAASAEPGVALAALADRLGNRLGLTNVVRPRAVASHLPERRVAWQAAVRLAAAAPASPAGVPWPEALPRPLCLFLKPEPVAVVAPVPDDPPVLFRWRKRVHRIAWAEGPERVGAEWWRAVGAALAAAPFATRDYFRVEDEEGRRFWLYRSGLYRADPAPVLVIENRDSDPEVPHRERRGAVALASPPAAAGPRPASPMPGPAWFVHGIFA
jgi:protein ImuB